MSEISFAEGLIMDLMQDANDIIWSNDEDDAARIEVFMAEFEGCRHKLRQTGQEEILLSRNKHGVIRARGWLMLNASLLLNQGNDVSVVASSSSSSMSSASLSSVVREIQCSNELSHDEKDRLELELARMKDAAESKNGRQFSEKLKKRARDCREGVWAHSEGTKHRAGRIFGLLAPCFV